MKKLIFLILLLFNLLPAGAVKKFEANPIFLAVMLTEKADSSSIASTCEYYGYIKQPSQDGYEVYMHPNGSIIKYTYTTEYDEKQYVSIEVKSKDTRKEKDNILKQLNFHKSGGAYERRSNGNQTRCSYAPGDFLRFSNHPKPKVAY